MRLSVIIIEFRQMADVLRCTASIDQHLGGVEHECIVVSNSEYTSAELREYRKRLPRVQLLAANSNRGYAGGVNLGIAHSSGEYVYVLNPDSCVLDGGIVSILRAMDEDERWAIAGPRVVDEDGRVQPSCRRFPRPWTFLLVRSALNRLRIARRERKRYLMEDLDRRCTSVVDWVSGGAMILKRQALGVIGNMDERYFLYMEDVDLCRASSEAGYLVKYSPGSSVLHAGQHRSIGSGKTGGSRSHMRLHLASLCKYFRKWGLRGHP